VKTAHVEEFTEAIEVVDVVDEDEKIQQEVRIYVWQSTTCLFKSVPSWNNLMRKPLAEQSASDGRLTKLRGRQSKECNYK
jgi:hypothetical protein